MNIYIEGREGLYCQYFVRKTCPDGKAIFGQCSVLTEELRENCSDTFIFHHNQLEESICEIFDQLNCNLIKNNLEDGHRLKDDRVIVKFSNRKDCKQALSAKNDLKNINMADLGFEGNGLIYINQSLCFYYKMLWS